MNQWHKEKIKNANRLFMWSCVAAATALKREFGVDYIKEAFADNNAFVFAKFIAKTGVKMIITAIITFFISVLFPVKKIKRKYCASTICIYHFAAIRWYNEMIDASNDGDNALFNSNYDLFVQCVNDIDRCAGAYNDNL